MNNISIVFVDDEQDITNSVTMLYQQYNITTFTDPLAALNYINKNGCEILITDHRMPDISGLDLLVECKNNNLYNYAILLTAFADKSLLEQVINRKLVNMVIDKPFDPLQFKKVLDEGVAFCINRKIKEKEKTVISHKIELLINELKKYRDPIIGIEKGLSKVIKQVEIVAPQPFSVLLTGETGTGKELIARSIHILSNRKNGPFITVNCASIPENLFESEVFGHVKGAFTGAVDNHSGYIEHAHNGTLFLDEIGELPLPAQAKLLRVLQDKQIQPIGSQKIHTIDFRLITATNQNLIEAISDGTFRNDLFYRINDIIVNIPPLRKRKCDIPELLNYFCSKYAYEMKQNLPTIDDDVLNVLSNYNWPGNIREFDNAVKRAMIVNRESCQLKSRDFDFLNFNTPNYSYQECIDCLSELLFDKSFTLDSIRDDLVKSVLDQADGNIKRAIEMTGIDRNRFYRISI